MNRSRASSTALVYLATLLLVLALVGAVSAEPRVASLPDSLPDGFAVQLFGGATEIDGKRVALWSISAAVAPHEAIALIETKWRQQSQVAPLVSAKRDGWILLSRQHREALETVQIRSRGAEADGFLSRWSIESFASEPRRDASHWLPRSVRAGPEFVSNEGGFRVRTMVGSSHESPPRILDAVAHIAAREGLQRVDPSRPTGSPLPSPQASSKGVAANNAVARFAGRGRDLLVTIDHNPDTALTFVVAQLTETVR